MRHTENPGIVITVYSSILKDIYRYSEILMHIQQLSQATRGGMWEASLAPFAEKQRSVMILEKKALIVPIFGLNFPF